MNTDLKDPVLISVKNSMHQACEIGDLDEVKSLFQQWLARWAAMGSQENSLKYLEEPIYGAVHNNKVDVVEFFLDQGCHPHFSDTVGVAIGGGSIEVLQMFMDRGREIRDSHYMNPLQGIAMVDGTLLTFLIEQGGSLQQMGCGETSMDIAAREGSKSAMTVLLAHGCDMVPSNALHIAAGFWNDEARLDLVDFVLMNGADIDAIEYPYMGPSNYDTDIVTLPWPEYGTALHRAIYANHEDVVRLLIESGADVDVKTTVGRTALDLVKEKEYFHFLPYLERS